MRLHLLFVFKKLGYLGHQTIFQKISIPVFPRSTSRPWHSTDYICETLEVAIYYSSKSHLVRAESYGSFKPCIIHFTECVINGQRVGEGRDVRVPEEPCLSCRCVHGALSCAKRACPVLPCPRAHQHTPPGECCPRCSHPTADKILPSKLFLSSLLFTVPIRWLRSFGTPLLLLVHALPMPSYIDS